MIKKINWWSKNEELTYIHWTKDSPKNQVQFSFRNNWILFKEIIERLNVNKGDCIELGCGRGNMSLYFANDGWNCTLLDNSKTVINVAKKIFSSQKIKANFLVSDAIKIKTKKKYDVCVSIGLLEHLPDLESAISSQINLLKTKGLFLMYVVPDIKPKVQKNWIWLNSTLRLFKKNKFKNKPPVYRSNQNIKDYFDCLRKLNVTNLDASGVYPLPMISHSIEFPFSLNNKIIEFILTQLFKSFIFIRGLFLKKNPWLCKEDFGQAFLVWGQKN